MECFRWDEASLPDRTEMLGTPQSCTAPTLVVWGVPDDPSEVWAAGRGFGWHLGEFGQDRFEGRVYFPGEEQKPLRYIKPPLARS